MPPDRRGGAPTPESADHHPTTTRYRFRSNSHSIGHQPAVGRYAAGWQHGFTAGALDALRLVGRQLPPESWAIVEQLADAYEAVAP